MMTIRMTGELFALALLALVVGCGDTTKPNAEPGEKEQASAPVTLELTETSLKTLAAADAADGSADQTVHLCYSCALGMDGKSEFAATAGEYTLHFCSAGCLDHFQENAEKTIADTKIPDASKEGESEEDPSAAESGSEGNG